MPVQKKIESYDDYSLRCLELIASLLSGTAGGTGITPGAGTVTTATIADLTITAIKIADGNVTTAKIADAAITTDKIADGSIQTVDLADGAIATAKIVDGAITSAKILDGAVGTADLGTAAVTTAKLADGNVTTAKIADAAITSDKIADGAVGTLDLADGSVTSAKILDGTILAIDIADGVITAAKLAAGAVGTASIPDSAITSLKILDAAITAAKLATNAVNTTAIVDAAVTTAKIANDAITSGKIADGAVGTVDLADGSVTAVKLAATAAVLSLNALKGNLILATGSNMSLATVGSTLTLNSSTAVSSLTAPTNPYPGQVWFNISGNTVSGILAGNYGIWNGTTWVSTGSIQPQGTLLTSVSVPANVTLGQAWQNISGGTLSAIPSGNVAVWNGTAWVNTIHIPSTITTSVARVGFLVEIATFAITTATLGTLIIPTTKVYDTFGAFDMAAGTYTIPASQQGTWLWDVGCSAFNDGAQSFNIFGTKNATVVAITDVLHSASAKFGGIGQRPMRFVAGDVIRFYGNGAAAGNNVLSNSSFYATRVQQIG